MRFKVFASVLLCIVLLLTMMLSVESSVAVSTIEATITPDDAGAQSSHIIREIERGLYGNGPVIHTGNARAVPDARFWMGPMRVSLWGEWTNIDLFLGPLFISTDFMQPNNVCKNLGIYIDLWLGTHYENVALYPAGPC